MTTINGNSSQRIDDKNTLRAKFTGSGPAVGHIGVEAEFFICERSSGAYAAPAVIQQLFDKMKQKGYAVSTEACGVLEINMQPFAVGEMEAFQRACDTAEADLKALLEGTGYVALNTSIPPFIRLAEAEQAVIPRERILDMISSVKTLLPEDALRVGLLTASAQVSVDYRDEDDLYRKLHRGYAISPLLISLFASDAGRLEGKAVPHHIRGTLYNAYGDHANGVPDYLRGCKNGKEIIDAHIEKVCEAPMLYYYENEKAVYPRSLSDTFNSLAKRGLNTEANFEAAESFLYHDIKLKPLPDGKRRLEFRIADAGFGHMKTAGVLVNALVCNEETAEIFDRLLKKFGFSGDLDKDIDLLQRNRRAALQAPVSQDAAFGNGTLRDFVTDLRREILPHLPKKSEARKTLSALFRKNRRPLGAKYRSMTDRQLKKALCA